MVIVIDVDGTLANNDHRRHFLLDNARDWNSFYREDLVWQDPPYLAAQAAMMGISKTEGAKLVILTGRPERLRKVTSDWLLKHFNLQMVPPDEPGYLNGPWHPRVAQMFMRGNRDYRHANVYKESKVEWMKETSTDKSFIFIDDDARCYEMYQKHGIILKPLECWGAIR